MWEHMLEQPEQIPAYTRSLAEMQAHLLSLVPPVSLPALHDRLTCKIRRAAARVDPALVAALELLPDGARTHLCHGDLHPGNVIMAGEGPVIIDWFDAGVVGDHVADVREVVAVDVGPGSWSGRATHLPGAGPELLDLVRNSYLVATTEIVAPDQVDLRRWVAVDAVARIAEGIAADALLAIWHDMRCPGLSSVLDDGSQLLEDSGRGRDDEIVVLRTRELGHGSSLASDQRTRGVVPHLGVPFEVGVGPMSTDPAQLERRRPEAADVVCRGSNSCTMFPWRPRMSARYEKPVKTSAAARDAGLGDLDGPPSTRAPSPTAAENVSFRSTSTTAPATTSPSTAAATLTAITGRA